MESGFSLGQSNNLPKVDLLMVAVYFTNHAKYISAEIQGQKLVKSGRDSYGDNAVGYVQVKREKAQCIVKARITPEHKVRATPYQCTFVCDETAGKIISLDCEGCAASKGGCKHTMAFVMWLHRRSEEPACTEVKCYWSKPKLSQVGSHLKFIKAKDMGNKKNTIQTNQTSNGTFLQSVVRKSMELKTESQIMNYFCPTEEIHKISVYYLATQFKKEDCVKDADSFILFCQQNMHPQQCEAIEKATRTQAKCQLWFEMRYARITASKAHESAQCSTPDGVLVECILGAYQFKETFAVKRGKLLEDEVCKEVSIIKNKKFKKVGLILSPDYPILGASPDGMVSEEYILEIKCPESNKKFKNYVKGGVITKKYYAQMQMQMFFTKKEKCLFCLAHEDFETSRKTEIYEVTYDEDYCEELIKKCIEFWKENIFKELF